MRSLKIFLFIFLFFNLFEIILASDTAFHVVRIKIKRCHRFKIVETANPKEHKISSQKSMQNHRIWKHEKHFIKITYSADVKNNDLILNKDLMQDESGFVMLPQKTPVNQNNAPGKTLVYTIIDL